ncbi:MAG: energy-coupling factor transporter transmembrane protein EcfT [Syntrophaceae bacterium]|nr:energy-coupling factor transporter transmembrane protein EcfT [Syntrophaceae bacterium]
MIRLGQYLPGRSFGHRLDARFKVLSVVGFSLVTLQAQGWETLLLTLVLLVAAALAGLRPPSLLAALRPLWFFASLLFGLHFFFTEGQTLFSLPWVPVTVTGEGLRRGVFVAWQFLFLASFGVLLAMTTAPTELICALERLLKPLERLHVPTQDIAVMVSMAMRFVPTFQEEYERIRVAQVSRGAAVGAGPLKGRARAAVSLVIPLLTSTLRRAEELADAMEARGYGVAARTTLHPPRFGREEWQALSLFILLLLLLFACRVLL